MIFVLNYTVNMLNRLGVDLFFKRLKTPHKGWDYAIIGTLFLGMLGFQSCQPQSDPWPYEYNDWEVANLQGQVKSVVKKAYSADTNAVDKKSDRLFGHEEKYFNPDGLLTKDILYRDATTELGYSLYRYDVEKNELIEQQYQLN